MSSTGGCRSEYVGVRCRCKGFGMGLTFSFFYFFFIVSVSVSVAVVVSCWLKIVSFSRALSVYLPEG